jgi:biotin operon repressor
MSMFLSVEDLNELTGRKAKSKQIEALKKMGLTFFINAAGRPVVPSSVIDGNKSSNKPTKKWIMPE